MPIYEYECENCHQTFELMQKIHEEPATQCPQCFKHTAVRLVSAAGFQLKGNGWYATDFKNGNAKKVENKTEEKVDKSSDKSKAKTESSVTKADK